jgi:hypothetical protein
MDKSINQHCCEEMAMFLAEQKVAITYAPHLREYAIPLIGNDNVTQLIRFCPWCGQRLPESLREVWFHRLWDLGLEQESPDIPAELRTDEWWRTTQV